MANFMLQNSFADNYLILRFSLSRGLSIFWIRKKEFKVHEIGFVMDYNVFEQSAAFCAEVSAERDMSEYGRHDGRLAQQTRHDVRFTVAL